MLHDAWPLSAYKKSVRFVCRRQNCIGSERKAKMLLTIDELNQLNFQDFIGKTGNVIEHCPVLAGALWKQRPFQSFEDLTEKLRMIVHGLPLSLKEGILRVYPDLAGRLAKAGELTGESLAEHAKAQLDQLSMEEEAILGLLNDQYKDKFGFPFVICARLNKKETIIEGLKKRTNNPVDTEVQLGIEEVMKICELRLKDIVDSKL